MRGQFAGVNLNQTYFEANTLKAEAFGQKLRIFLWAIPRMDTSGCRFYLDLPIKAEIEKFPSLYYAAIAVQRRCPRLDIWLSEPVLQAYALSRGEDPLDYLIPF